MKKVNKLKRSMPWSTVKHRKLIRRTKSFCEVVAQTNSLETNHIEPSNEDISEVSAYSEPLDEMTDVMMNRVETLREDVSEVANLEPHGWDEMMFIGRQQLKDAGMVAYFESVIGGSRSSKAIRALENHVLEFLFWMHSHVYEQTLDLITTDIVSWFIDVVQHHYDSLSDYSMYLETVKDYQSGSIVNILCDIIAVAKWISHFKPLKDVNGNSIEIKMGPFEFVLKAIAKHSKRKRSSAAKLYDFEAAVEARRFPREGLKTLIQCVVDDIQVHEETAISSNFFNKTMYEDYVSLMYSALYVLSAQGRVGGMQSLQMKHADALLQNGYVLAKDFKTNSKWTYQPVTISLQSGKLVRRYITEYRQKISAIESPNDPLWVDWKGNPETDIGRLVTRYFRKKLDLHITTTAIRSLVETQAQDLFEQGIISLADRESVSHINGHTSQIARTYYVERDRVRDIFNTRNLFRHIVEADGDVKNDFVQAVEFGGVEWPISSHFEYCDWGTNHPDYNKPSKRAIWSAAELQYISDWMSNRLLTKVSRGKLQTVSALWKYITQGPGKASAQPIFHRHHVLNSTRLRHGYRVVCGDRPARIFDEEIV